MLSSSNLPARSGLARRDRSPVQRFIDHWHRHRRLFEGRRLLGLVLIVGTGFVVYSTSATAQQQSAQHQDQRLVYVATQNVAAGGIVVPEAVTTQFWPAHLVPPSAVTADPTGRTLVRQIEQGEPFTSARVGHGTFGLAPDELAVAIPVPLAPPPVEKGHGVILVSLQPPDGPFQQTSSVLTAARILFVTDLAITVAVPERDAQRVVEALATGSIEVIITPR